MRDGAGSRLRLDLGEAPVEENPGVRPFVGAVEEREQERMA